MQIGLFFSGAGGLIERSLDLGQLTKEYSADHFVSVYKDFFNAGDLQNLLNEIRVNRFDAVLLIGESPLSYVTRRSADQILNEIEALGVNPNKIGFVNLKEQLAMVHHGQKQDVTRKAKLLIDAEIERVKIAEMMKVIPVAPRKAVAIIGASATGYLAAQQLLQKGYTIHIIKPRFESPDYLPEDEECLKPVFTFVENHTKYRFYSGVRIDDIYGYAGDFTVELSFQSSPVSLAVGAIIVANPENLEVTQKIHDLLNLDIDEQGYIRPRNQDTLLAYTSEEGMFLARNYHTDLGRTVAAADSAVLAVTELLDCPEIKHKIKISEINKDLCGGCGTCVKTCMFHACKVDFVEKVAVINPKRCKGCGNCVTACPTGARDLLTYPQKYLFKAVDILSQFESPEGKVLLFLCEGCGYQAMDAAAAAGLEYPVGVMPLKVRCGGTIDTQLILQAFKKGFDGVVVCKCQEGHCSNIVGNVDLDRRANLFREILRSRNIDTERLRIVDALHAGENKCVRDIIDLYREFKDMGGDVGE